MARKLPWAVGSEASKAPAKRAPASRAHKREPSISSSDDESNKKKPAALAQSKLKYESTPQKKRGSRSPSSSPIRGPPTAAPMVSGYDQDDIYVLVEDELQAVAQTYTHHLHAAEHKRLKKKAREAPPRTLPDLKDDALKAVKRKFEVLALQDKQRRTLADDDGEKVGPSDPWLGTSLAGLMGSSSQPRRALTLSQEIPSSTRAANGYGRGESESPGKRTRTAMSEAAVQSKPEPKPVLQSRTTMPKPEAQGGRNGTRFSAAAAAVLFKSTATDTQIISIRSRAPDPKDTKPAPPSPKPSYTRPNQQHGQQERSSAPTTTLTLTWSARWSQSQVLRSQPRRGKSRRKKLRRRKPT